MGNTRGPFNAAQLVEGLRNAGYDAAKALEPYLNLGSGTGGSFISVSETDAKNLVATNSLEAGSCYIITLDGTSNGTAGDFLYLYAAGSSLFQDVGTRFYSINGATAPAFGSFTSSGWFPNGDYVPLTEAQAITYASTSQFEKGKIYIVSGGTGGSAYSIYAIAANSSQLFVIQYFDASRSAWLNPHAHFRTTGLVIEAGDPVRSVIYTFDSGSTTELDLTDYRMYGTIDLLDTSGGDNYIDSIIGLQSGDVITFKDSSSSVAGFDVTALTIAFTTGFVGNFEFSNNVSSFITLRYNGSGFEVINIANAYTGGPREFTFNAYQTSTNAPTISILKNTFQEQPTINYVSTGVYSLEVTTATFTTGKLGQYIVVTSDDQTVMYQGNFSIQSSTILYLEIFAADGTTHVDNWGAAGFNSTFTLKLYP